jgi:hypothetical protein
MPVIDLNTPLITPAMVLKKALLEWIDENEFHIVDTHYAVPVKNLKEKIEDLF